VSAEQPKDAARNNPTTSPASAPLPDKVADRAPEKANTAALPAGATATAANDKPAAPVDGKLAGLMATGTTSRAPDIEQEALRAAEEALEQGQRALAEARAHLGTKRPRSRARELALRLLLAVNVAAMVTVVLLPQPVNDNQKTAEPPTATGPQVEPKPTAVTEPAPTAVKSGDLYLRALEQADRGNYAEAIAQLERYLEESPRLLPARRFNIYTAMSHYAAQMGNDTRAAEFDRRASALVQSHRLPEDLVMMAHEAKDRGDAEALRRIWARFLLQQRQIPSSLYKHVAEAYLELGDSYRMGAQQAQDAADAAALEQLRSKLHQEAASKDGSKDSSKDGKGGGK
jgi:tetratricopeptide (TPR) repeat protein